MKSAKSDLPQGTLDLLILKVVALGPVHGYAIAQRLDQVSRGVVQVPQGSLYPALHRLENRGLLAAGRGERETGRGGKGQRAEAQGRGWGGRRANVLPRAAQRPCGARQRDRELATAGRCDRRDSEAVGRWCRMTW